MTKRQGSQPYMVDAMTLPLFQVLGTHTCHALSPEDRAIIDAIRRACKIDKSGHWIWQGRVRYYGAPCMTYQRVTRPVRQVLYSILDDEHQIGMPLIPRCGNPLCVAPGCILPKRNADLMAEARKKKGEAPEQIQIPPGIWGQLMIAGRKS